MLLSCLYQGILIGLDNLDRVVTIIRGAKDGHAASEALQQGNFREESLIFLHLLCIAYEHGFKVHFLSNYVTLIMLLAKDEFHTLNP